MERAKYTVVYVGREGDAAAGVVGMDAEQVRNALEVWLELHPERAANEARVLASLGGRRRELPAFTRDNRAQRVRLPRP